MTVVQASLFPVVRVSKPRAPRGPRISIPDDAVELLCEWYETRSPKPQVKSWPGATKVIAKFLLEWKYEQVRHALRQCDVISINWLENALRKLYPPSLAAVTDGGYVRQEVPDFEPMGE